MKEVFIYYKKYLKWIDGQNKAVNMRNAKTRKAHDPSNIRPPELEPKKQPSLLGFLEWGANES